MWLSLVDRPGGAILSGRISGRRGRVAMTGARRGENTGEREACDIPSRWDRWAEMFEAERYAPLTPGRPDDPQAVET